MKDINDLMPRIPRMRWGALMNMPPTRAKCKYLDRILPHDAKWHTLFETENETIIDGIGVRRKTQESMT